MKKLLLIAAALFLVGQVSPASDYSTALKEGLGAVNRGETSRAEEIFSALVEEYPERPEAYCGLALKSIAGEDFDSALEFLGEAAELFPRYPQIYYLKGLSQEYLGRDRESLENYKKYLSLSEEEEREDIYRRIKHLEEKLEN